MIRKLICVSITLAMILVTSFTRLPAALGQERERFGIALNSHECFSPTPDVHSGVEQVLPSFGGQGLGDTRKTIETHFNWEVHRLFAPLEYISPTFENFKTPTTSKLLQVRLGIFGSGFEEECQGVSYTLQLYVFDKDVKPLSIDKARKSGSFQYVIGCSEKSMVSALKASITNSLENAAAAWHSPHPKTVISFYAKND